MRTNILSTEDLCAKLMALPVGSITRLSELSGVPLQTIYSIRSGRTKVAGLETARRIIPHLRAAARVRGEARVAKA